LRRETAPIAETFNVAMLRTTILCVVASTLLLGCFSHPEPPIVQYQTQYHFPLTSPGSKFGALPPPAQNTVRAEVGMAEITDVVKLPSVPSGAMVYKICFRNDDLFPPLYVAADGSLLNPDLSLAAGAPADTFGVISGGPVTGVKLSELPPPVSKTLHDRAPNVGIASVNKETWGDRVVYIVSFSDPAHHPRLYLAADGTVLNEGPK
jgi:hypothetical protein